MTIVWQCTQQLWPKRKKNKGAILLLLYTGVIFVLATLGFAGNAKFVELTYIDDRNYPGGPNAFTNDFYSFWVNTMGFSRYFL